MNGSLSSSNGKVRLRVLSTILSHLHPPQTPPSNSYASLIFSPASQLLQRQRRFPFPSFDASLPSVRSPHRSSFFPLKRVPYEAFSPLSLFGTSAKKSEGDRVGNNVSFSEKKETSAGATAFSLESGYCSIPHPEKAAKGGEDAHFLTKFAMGVADGVGGWSEVGIDPSLYSRALMEGAKAEATKGNLDPVEIMEAGYRNAKEIVGSSTACVVVLEGDKLKAANVGDSGFMVVRKSEMLIKSKEQQFAWNAPLQLGTGSKDTPTKTADRYELKVEEGDIILLATDGVFDNLYPSEIVEVCKVNIRKEATGIANAIGKAAFEASNEAGRNTPFDASVRARFRQSAGGKPDDITVVVARVTQQSAAAQQ